MIYEFTSAVSAYIDSIYRESRRFYPEGKQPHELNLTTGEFGSKVDHQLEHCSGLCLFSDSTVGPRSMFDLEVLKQSQRCAAMHSMQILTQVRHTATRYGPKHCSRRCRL